jgi:restriction endonuclease S subunit
MDEYKIILEEKQTVMARYEVEPKSGEGYQSETQLEQRQKQYEYYRNKLLTFE